PGHPDASRDPSKPAIHRAPFARARRRGGRPARASPTNEAVGDSIVGGAAGRVVPQTGALRPDTASGRPRLPDAPAVFACFSRLARLPAQAHEGCMSMPTPRSAAGVPLHEALSHEPRARFGDVLALGFVLDLLPVGIVLLDG